MGSLQVPVQGRGRSRFSKALPAIPPIDTTFADEQNRSVPPSLAPISVSTTTSATITPVNLSDLPPPPPPPHNDDPRVPIQYTPLPPLPPSKQASKATLATPITPTASGPPKMKIPRRPVGSINKADTAKPQTSNPTQAQALALTPAPSATAASMPPPVSKSQPFRPAAQIPNQQQQPQAQYQELPPQLPSFRTSVFTIEQEPPEPPSKAAKRQVQSPPVAMTDQEQPMKKEPEREAARESARELWSSQEKEQLELSNIQLQSQLFPKPPSSAAAAAAIATSGANDNMRAFQKPQEPQQQEPQAPQAPPEPSPQTIDYLQPSESAQPLKSPSDSLSSILSAYSRSSTQSIVRSSDGTYSTRDSHAQESPNHHISSSTTEASAHYHESLRSVTTITPSTAQPQFQSFQPRPIANGNDLAFSPAAPPPPSKDYVSQRPFSPPTRGDPVEVESGTSSPPQKQIWRRRSLKGSRELPSLHLDYSHGSTASTSSVGTAQSQVTVVPAQPQHPSAPVQPTAAPRPPTKEILGLPGRNVRPGHTQKQSADETTMGHGGSRLQQLKDKFHRSRKSDDKTSSIASALNSQNVSSPSGRPTHNRPPTPEYQKEDIETPHVDRITSPASPASSPESKAGPAQPPNQGPSQTSDHPIASAARTNGPSPHRKQLPNTGSVISDTIPSSDGPAELEPVMSSTIPFTTGLSIPGSSLHPAKSLPDLKGRGATTPIMEPFPPLSAFPGSGRNSPAPDGPYARGRQFDGPGRHPASRESSARPDSRRAFDPTRSLGPDGSRFVRSSTGELCYKGRDGTLYPEMKEPTKSPDPKAMRFPSSGGQPIADGTILQAAPLKDSHYSCFQRHRTMLRQRNRRYPLTCQTCLKADVEDRWTCTFCSLRLCESCLGIFESNKKDLTGLITNLAGKKTLSLSSPLRPGSSLGLSAMS